MDRRKRDRTAPCHRSLNAGILHLVKSANPLRTAQNFGNKILMPKLILTSLAALALTGCNSAPPAPKVDAAAEQAKLRDVEAAWNKEATAKDVDKAAGHYTDDAVLMLSGAPAFKGKDAIHGAWKGMLEDPNLKIAFSADQIEISQDGDLATTRGSYTLTSTDPKTKKPVDDKGSYMTVYRKQPDGGWKAIEDVAVSELH